MRRKTMPEVLQIIGTIIYLPDNVENGMYNFVSYEQIFVTFKALDFSHCLTVLSANVLLNLNLQASYTHIFALHRMDDLENSACEKTVESLRGWRKQSGKFEYWAVDFCPDILQRAKEQ